MIDAFGYNADHLGPGDRIVIVPKLSPSNIPATELGSQGTIVRVASSEHIAIVLDDERRVVLSMNMITEDDELPADPAMRGRVEALIDQIKAIAS